MGRYYYHNLRDKENNVTEAHCLALDEIEQRLDAALDQLEPVLQRRRGAGGGHLRGRAGL